MMQSWLYELLGLPDTHQMALHCNNLALLS